MSNPVGRPSEYLPEYNTQVYKLCLLGATDKELADFFGVSEQTVNAWKINYPDFLESLKKGKEKADMEIAESLYERAKGYEITREQAFKVKDANGNEDIKVVPVTEEIPADPTSMIFWLKNRKSREWRDKQENVNENHNINQSLSEYKAQLDAEREAAIKEKNAAESQK
jgi:hypothetical protein